MESLSQPIQSEQTQVVLARDIEIIEDRIAKAQEFIVITRNMLARTPEPDILETLRVEIADNELSITETRAIIAHLRTLATQTQAEIDRIPSPEQAITLQQTILTAKATISQLQLQKARIPVTVS